MPPVYPPANAFSIIGTGARLISFRQSPPKRAQDAAPERDTAPTRADGHDAPPGTNREGRRLHDQDGGAARTAPRFPRLPFAWQERRGKDADREERRPYRFSGLCGPSSAEHADGGRRAEAEEQDEQVIGRGGPHGAAAASASVAARRRGSAVVRKPARSGEGHGVLDHAGRGIGVERGVVVADDSRAVSGRAMVGAFGSAIHQCPDADAMSPGAGLP